MEASILDTDICGICGNPIVIQIRKGTRLCSNACEKLAI